jgi:hypothetical protein
MIHNANHLRPNRDGILLRRLVQQLRCRNHDPGRNLILSPNEGNNYRILSLNSSTGAVTGELDRSITTGGARDSAAEVRSTGIGLSSPEFTSNAMR